MTRDEKIDLHRQIAAIEKAVKDMNGPYAETTGILSRLGTLREVCLDDDVMTGCEVCDEPIFESEADSAVMSEDSGWFCAGCVARWNDSPGAPT